MQAQDGGFRVGFFTEVYRPVVNGVVESVETLAAGLRAHGHEVYCFAPRMPGADKEEPGTVAMPSLPLPTKTPYRLTLPLVSRRTVNNVVKRLNIAHAHSMFVTGWTALRYARRYGIPIVYTYHTQLEDYAHYVPFEPRATRFAAKQLTRTFGNLVDAVIVPTEAVERRLRATGVETRIDVVPSAIDVARFAAGTRSASLRKKLGMRANERMLLCVSRLAKEKNVGLLIEALACANDNRLRLIIAGDGPAREELADLAMHVGVGDAVRFLGAVSREELPDLYASADGFVFASTTETQGLVQAEALAAGAHVIAADHPTNREVVGEAGLIVPAEVAAFAAAMRAVPAERPEGAIARARAGASRFGVERQVAHVQAIYARLRNGDLDVSNTRSI